MSQVYGCDFPSDRDAITLTDWAEAVMIVEDLAEFSEADLRGRIAEQTDDEAAGDEASGRQHVEDVLREVSRREKFASEAYPFRRTEFGIQRVNSPHLSIYSFLLFLSMREAPFRDSVYSNEVSPLFDFVGAAALSDLFGSRARTIRFGWPITGERPTGPRVALEWLASQLGLKHDKDAPLRARLKDGGVDVVIWRPFEDGRVGFPILLAQCTVGYREWEKKGRDIQRKLWSKYLGLPSSPPTALVLPFCVHRPDRFEVWEIVSHEVTFLIDRIRLLDLLAAVDPTSILDHDKIRAWTEERMQDLALA
jgi:hypothetical protein